MNVLWIHVRNGDGSNMLEELKQNGYRAPLISSTESFLDYGETTMLVGVDNDQCDDVIRRIKAHYAPAEPTGNKREEVCIYVLKTANGSI